MLDPQPSARSAPVIQWHQMTSSKGFPYEIGRIKTDRNDQPENPSDTLVESALSAMKIAPTSKEDFGIAVNWPVGSKEWKDPGQEVKGKAGISRFAIHDSSHPLFDYVVEFTNTENYNFFFYDETGDHYQVNTHKGGDHLVRYNSQKPTVKFITGS